MRGFGVPQLVWAYESHTDIVARALGIDPLAFRQLNALQEEIRKADAAFGNAGRHLIRYSGTENKLRILVEHQDKSEVERWSQSFKAAVEADFETL